MNKKCGFTLLELVLVISILGIIIFAANTMWLGFRTRTEIDSTARNIVDVLRRAQNNAITGENFTTWGVRFDNGTGDFFQLFSGANWTAGTRYEYFALSSGVTFNTPAESANTEILFDIRTGKRNVGAANIIIQSSTLSSLTRTISVSSEGGISAD